MKQHQTESPLKELQLPAEEQASPLKHRFLSEQQAQVLEQACIDYFGKDQIDNEFHWDLKNISTALIADILLQSDKVSTPAIQRFKLIKQLIDIIEPQQKTKKELVSTSNENFNYLGKKLD
jgi:hypothetical protein